MPMAFETDPFNGDPHIGERIRELVAKHGVRTIVETGTYKGVTTRELMRMCDMMFTIEKNPKYHAAFFDEPVDMQTHALCGDSRECLPRIMGQPDAGPFLFYLDAHWGRDWPLLGELAAIADAGIKPVIVIHDFEVPGTDLGFDEYGGQRLNWEYIEDAVVRIYGSSKNRGWDPPVPQPDCIATTNTPERAAGARRGVLYLEPKEE